MWIVSLRTPSPQRAVVDAFLRHWKIVLLNTNDDLALYYLTETFPPFAGPKSLLPAPRPRPLDAANAMRHGTDRANRWDRDYRLFAVCGGLGNA